ncbi:Pycsar system effector family protein [Kitasatospora sp. HPMI-4]|uniref:Pycsar system effector family protein n=1 Tax=Kitasatospora sp. HPMI-4 TaxID=3448443 RepID=UPI003F1B8742
MAANSAELTRADTKAAVLLGFTGAALGVFLPLTGNGAQPWEVHALRWTAVVSALLAVICFVCAIAPRRRRGRRQGPAGPSYFEHIPPEAGGERLSRAFERAGGDPTGPLLSSLSGTSEIIRVKYRWIETGTALLLLALPQFAAALQSM